MLGLIDAPEGERPRARDGEFGDEMMDEAMDDDWTAPASKSEPSPVAGEGQKEE
jgi:hypothetical protein